MQQRRKSAVIIFLSAAIGLLSASCADSKFSQCERIIQISVRVTQQTNELCSNCETENTQEALQVADVMEKAAEDMAATAINDPQLQTYQQGFIDIYRGMSQSTREFVAALNQKDINAAKSAKVKLQQVGSTEKEIVDGINNYCNSN